MFKKLIPILCLVSTGVFADDSFVRGEIACLDVNGEHIVQVDSKGRSHQTEFEVRGHGNWTSLDVARALSRFMNNYCEPTMPTTVVNDNLCCKLKI